MNDSAQASSNMASKIKSSFLSPARQGNDQPTAPVAAGDDQAVLTDQQKLTVFSDVLDSVETQAAENLNPPHSVATGGKEAIDVSASPDQGPVDAGAIQHVEQEKNPEIPVEVEGYLQKVEDLAEERPQEVVIADGTSETESANYPSRPVVVLPITQEIEEKGKKKNPTFSIRWLVEWSHKIIKMFAGKVVYRQETAQS